MKKENLEKILTLRHDLHRHPELSMEESWTRGHLMDFLREHTRNLEIVDQGRWFYALYRAPSPRGTIAFRADFDALPIEEDRPDRPYASTVPGVAHKCGHDGHAATLAGLALEVDQDGCDKNVVFLFQHAEEIGAGARETVEKLVELGVEECYAYHNFSLDPPGAVLVREGVMHCASTGMTIAMTGAVTHASMPEKGRSPALPLARLACALPELAAPERRQGLVLCTIVQIDVGQKAFGVAPGRGELSVTVRAEHEAELDALVADIRRLAEQLSAQAGLALEITFQDAFPETRSTGWCVDKVRSAAGALGLPLVEAPAPHRASEDLGHILKAVPGCAFGICAGGDRPDLHADTYDFPDGILEEAVDLYRQIIRQ